ncbi:hypothetical protein [Bifidobacterium leontopitheci]|uniref:Uncharacterized protein n=1 Tax=Bifidobacterium leontopitheci TaxID=2650774 RepID=A0A6I1GII2_9BIFI|nr:hypothetical protein [Bifidobacterium leontopitheci]KAB7791453.1 hypothetical protein F7D09_0128 [Bifidobacterium leontopitheci]
MKGRTLHIFTSMMLCVLLAMLLAIGASSSRSLIAQASDEANTATDSTEPDEYGEAAKSLANAYGLPEDTAKRRVEGQSDRMMFRTLVAEKLGDTIGGFSYDPVSGTTTVSTTDEAKDTPLITQLAEQYGVAITITPADYSYAQLDEWAQQILAEASGNPSILDAYPDPETNSVTIKVDKRAARNYESLPTVSTLATQSVPITIVAGEETDTSTPDICTGKSSCGAPLRGGINILSR